jgi:hypothetical protein
MPKGIQVSDIQYDAKILWNSTADDVAAEYFAASYTIIENRSNFCFLPIITKKIYGRIVTD